MQGVTGLAHLGVAVRDLAAAESAYRALGGRLEGREEVAGEGVVVSFVALGDMRIELLQPLQPDAEGGVARFLRERGGGVHHLALQVAELDALLAALAAEGVRPLGAGPRPGAAGRRVAFLHPRDTGGVLLELCEVPR